MIPQEADQTHIEYGFPVIILEVITDQCSAFDLIKKIEVLDAGIEVDFIFTGQLDYK